jgi:hypothetical protein
VTDDAELHDLRAQAAAIAAAQLPLLLAFGLALMAVFGLILSSTFLGIVGWFGGFLVGLFAVSRGASAIALAPALKYPAFIATFVPGLAAVATGGVWWLTRGAATTTAEAIESLERAERLRARRPAPAATASASASAPNVARPNPAPAPSPAPAAAPAAPKPIPEQALPVVRAVFDAPADPNSPIKVSAGIERPEGMSDADWALFAEAVGPVARADGHFLVMYRMDNGASWLFVNEDVREQSGLTRDGLHRKALQNLSALARRPGLLRKVENPPFVGLLLDGDHESSLVLLDEIWRAVLRDDCPNGAVVTIPARDLCAYCDAGSPEGIIALREMAAKFRGQRGEVSQQLMLYTAEGWSAFR